MRRHVLNSPQPSVRPLQSLSPFWITLASAQERASLLGFCVCTNAAGRRIETEHPEIGSALLCFWRCFGRSAKHFDNMCSQTFFDLPVARDRLRNFGWGISVPIVFLPVPNENATQAFDGPYKVGSLHATIRSSTLRMPGSSPLVRSAKRSRRCSFKSSMDSPWVQ